MPPRPERLYFIDIIESCDAIATYISHESDASFLASRLVQRAVLMELVTIGEAAAHISPELRSAYPDVPWQRIVAFRNVAVHTYFALDLDIVWETALHDVPVLKEELAAILAAEYPEEQP